MIKYRNLAHLRDAYPLRKEYAAIIARLRDRRVKAQDSYLSSSKTRASYPTDDLSLARNASPEAGLVKEEDKLHGIHAQRILEARARGWSGTCALVRRLRLFALGEGQDDGASAAQQGAIAEAI
jgi:hypothetical protein